MRIAICISGLVRTYIHTYENFVDSLVNPNKHHTIDIFIGTQDTEHSNISMERDRRVAWSATGDPPPFPEESINYERLTGLYLPTAISINRRIDFDISWYTPVSGVNIKSILSMMYLIYEANRLKCIREETEGFKYDVVIRTRFDQLLPNPIEVDKLDLDKLLVPSMMQPHVISKDMQWTNDKFAAGSSANLDKYCGWYHALRSLLDSGVPCQPETLLHTHLDRCGISLMEMGHELELVRIKGF